MDVLDHVVEASQQLQFLKHDLESSAQQYMARISIEMAAANNEMAAQMRQLSIAATVLLPLGLVAGLFGMNCRVPAQGVPNFVAFGSVMAVICVVVVLGAWKLDVLPRSIMLVRFPRYFYY
jgi:magnesium transporter